MATGGPFTSARSTPIAGIDQGTPMPGLPGEENDFMLEDYQPALPGLMSNDVVPSTATSFPDPTPEIQDALLGTREEQPALVAPMPTGFRQRGERPQRRVRVEPGGLGWAVGSDAFYPGGMRPNESRSTAVGKYGGVPLFAATMAFPDAVFASRLQGISQKRNNIQKAIQSLDPMAGVEDVNAPEYRDSFNRGAMGSINSYIADVYDMWGKEDGQQRLMTPGTEEYKGLRERGNQWTTVARSINQATKNADAIIEGMDGGSLDFDQKLYDQAQQVRHRLGMYAGQHDIAALSRELPALNATVDFYDEVKKDGLMDLLKKSAHVQDTVSLVKSGNLKVPGFTTFLNTKQTRSDLVDSLTEAYARRHRNIPRDTIQEFFERAAPSDLEEKVTVKANPRPKGSGKSNEVSDAQRYQADATVVPMNAVDVYGKPVNLATNANGEEVYRPTVNLMGFSNKQGKVAAPLEYRSGGNSVFMHPTRAMNVDGEIYIIGKRTGMPRTKAEVEAKGKAEKLSAEQLAKLTKGYDDIQEGNTDTEDAQATIEHFSTLQDVVVPLSGQNEGLLSQSLGVDATKLRKALAIHPGNAPVPQPAQDETTPLIPKWTSQEQFNALPVGALFIGPDGKKYKKTIQ